MNAVADAGKNESLCANAIFTELIHTYSPTVYRICFMYMKNKPDAEDAYQEVFTKLYIRLCKSGDSAFDSSDHTKAWLIRVAVNQCKSQLDLACRKKNVTFEDVFPDDCPDEKREVISSVMSLPEKYRSVIYFHYFEGYSTAEIADMTGTANATVRTRLARARDMLRSLLER